MNPTEQHDTTVVVTGAASGIGAATAEHLAGLGHHVVVADRRANPAEEVARELTSRGHRSSAAECDVADARSVDALFARVAEELPPLVGLVNNAGVGNLKPLEAYTPSEVDLIWSVNVSGTYNCLRSAAPLLRRNEGAVVNVASVSAVHPTRGEAPYSAAKAAVVALTASAALEWAPEVRVNCVSPGFIRTPLNDLLATNEEWLQGIRERTPAGRLGTPSDVAETVAFLLSDASAYVTGQNLVIDGGSVLTNAQMDPLFTELLG